jgi:threonine/homoserine/homoserine lactone efflux protein
MEINLLLKGLVLGFSIAAPVGPIGILCIRRTITDGWRAGLLSGLGAASADAIYGSIAGFGITLISGFLVTYQFPLRLCGGFFLLYLGVRTILAKPSGKLEKLPPRRFTSIYFTTFFLTLTNPMTIISFAAIFSGIGLISASTNYYSAVLLISGVFLGSGLWWIFLSFLVNSIRGRLDFNKLKWINMTSGILILGFGIASMVSLL